jgi:hypothetical protein
MILFQTAMPDMNPKRKYSLIEGKQLSVTADRVCAQYFNELMIKRNKQIYM